MAKKQKPLPKPPHTPFGRKRTFEEEDGNASMFADRMAKAIADGTLEEFLQNELPDNKHARKLAVMMMGMTGILPSEGFPGKPAPKKQASSKKTEAARKAKSTSALQPPEDVVHAAKNADVKGLMEFLEREHKKHQESDDKPVDEKNKDTAPFRNQAVIEKEVIDRCIKIASDNNVSFDWLFFRALTRYVEEYQKTGNL
jgi:hypothetical protein